MEVYFCDQCSARVTDADLHRGHGIKKGDVVVCGNCIEQGLGKDLLAQAGAVGQSAPGPALAGTHALDEARDRARTTADPQAGRGDSPDDGGSGDGSDELAPLLQDDGDDDQPVAGDHVGQVSHEYLEHDSESIDDSDAPLVPTTERQRREASSPESEAAAEPLEDDLAALSNDETDVLRRSSRGGHGSDDLVSAAGGFAALNDGSSETKSRDLRELAEISSVSAMDDHADDDDDFLDDVDHGAFAASPRAATAIDDDADHDTDLEAPEDSVDDDDDDDDVDDDDDFDDFDDDDFDDDKGKASAEGAIETLAMEDDGDDHDDGLSDDDDDDDDDDDQAPAADGSVAPRKKKRRRRKGKRRLVSAADARPGKKSGSSGGRDGGRSLAKSGAASGASSSSRRPAATSSRRKGVQASGSSGKGAKASKASSKTSSKTSSRASDKLGKSSSRRSPVGKKKNNLPIILGSIISCLVILVIAALVISSNQGDRPTGVRTAQQPVEVMREKVERAKRQVISAQRNDSLPELREAIATFEAAQAMVRELTANPPEGWTEEDLGNDLRRMGYYDLQGQTQNVRNRIVVLQGRQNN